MQKKIIALAVAALASTAAFAQTNVTIYGIADASISGTTYLGKTNQQTQFNVNSGTLSTSRLGFKGVEDLGNGLKALFVLEYGLAIDANQPVGYSSSANSSARQQFVGMTGGFGTVVAGHLQTTGLDFAVASSALAGSTALGATNQVGNPDGTAIGSASNTSLINAASRAQNAVAYISPSFAGVTFAYNHARVTEAAGTAVTGAAAVAGANTDATANLFSVSYDNGPITAGAIYARSSRPDTRNAANTLNTNDNVKEWGLRAGYDFQVVKLQAAYQHFKQDETGAGLKINDNNSKWVVSVAAPIGAKTTLIAEYAHLKVATDTTAAGVNPANNAQAATLAATYALSKRTTAYAGMVAKRTNNDTTSASYVTDTNTYAMGLRHAF